MTLHDPLNRDPWSRSQSVSLSVTQLVSQSISQSVSHSDSQSVVIPTTKVCSPRRLSPELDLHKAPVSCPCCTQSVTMAAATSRSPVFTYAVFLQPATHSSRRCHHAACYLSPGCHRQYRHICWSRYEESSGNEVAFKEKQSKNREGQQHRAAVEDNKEKE